MAIENRNLEVGAKLVAHYKKETYHALVIAAEDAKVRYTLTPNDGKEYQSLSSLGTAVTGKACNGWAFWSVGNDETPETEMTTDTITPTTADAEESTEEDAEPKSTYVAAGQEFTESTDQPKFHRVPNQKGVDPGQVRLYCSSCCSSFIVPDNQIPVTCPSSHLPS